MWRSISLRTRLNLIFASLFALWLAVDAGHVVCQASARARAETQSAMRLTKDFVATALARLPDRPRAGARSRRSSPACRTCRHVRAGLGRAVARFVDHARGEQRVGSSALVSRARQCAERSRRHSGQLERRQDGVDRHRRRSRRRDRRSLGWRARPCAGRRDDGARGVGGDKPSGRARGEASWRRQRNARAPRGGRLRGARRRRRTAGDSRPQRQGQQSRRGARRLEARQQRIGGAGLRRPGRGAPASSPTSSTTNSDRISSPCAPAPRCWRKSSATIPRLARRRARSRPRSKRFKARTAAFWPICVQPRSRNWGSPRRSRRWSPIGGEPSPEWRSRWMSIRASRR